MNILFTIAGRAGSKGIKNKNIKNFLGFPLPYYTLSAIELFAKKNKNHEIDVVLNTDSEDLIRIVEQKNIIIPCYIIRRVSSLAGDLVPKIKVISDCLVQMTMKTHKTYDVVIDLDLTSPLRTAENIQAVVEVKTENDFDVVFSVTESRRNPYFNMVREHNGQYVRVITSEFTTRQQTPEVYDMNASIYAYSPSFLEKNVGIFDGKCGIIKMIDTAVLDIDNEGDFELMEVIANHLFELHPELRNIRNNILQW